MLNKIESNFIAYLSSLIDKNCRKDLSNKKITSERDYVSNFTAGLRHPLGNLLPFKFANAYTLNGSDEQKFGCDGIIIFRKNDSVKIGLFEAKWPRISNSPAYPWDNNNQKTQVSRFSSQIERQEKWNQTGVYIWEMFFNEYPVGTKITNFDQYGSSCLPHKNAYAYLINTKKSNLSKWDNTDLNNVLSSNGMNIRRIIYNILRCNFGKVFHLKGENIRLLSIDKQEINIPILTKFENGKIIENKEIISFMSETGLSYYSIFDLTED